MNLGNSPDMLALLEVLVEGFRDNDEISKKLEALSDSRKVNVRKLKSAWINKEVPPKTQTLVRETCIKFYSEKDKRRAEGELVGENFSYMFTKEYVLHDSLLGTKGLCPYRGVFEKIQFAGSINFEQSFEPLVSFHSESRSVNIFDTWYKLIQKGSDLGLGHNQWTELILKFSQRYCKDIFQELVLRSNGADNNACFFHLIDTVSSDFELSKLRASLAGITRRPGEGIFIVSVKLLSLYRAIIKMTFPSLDLLTLEKRSEHLSKMAIVEFCDVKVKKLALSYCDRQLSLQRTVSLNELARFIDGVENNSKELVIKDAIALPPRLVFLDKISLDMSLNEVAVNYTRTGEANKRRPSGPRTNSTESSAPRRTVSPGQQPRSQSPRYRRNSRGRFTQVKKTNSQPKQGSSQDRGRPKVKKEPGKGSKKQSHSPRYRKTSQGKFRKTNSPYRRRSFSQKSTSKSSNGSYNSKPRPRRDRSNSFISCFRCGGNHPAKFCKQYPERSDSVCRKCGLEHNTAACLRTKKEKA